MTNTQKYTLSILLNFHREGDLADKTIQNLRNILNTFHKWEEVEIIAVLDNADEKTKDIIYANYDIFNNIEEVNYKDPSEARNHGVSIAKNEFILLGDGDDYCSHNMLSAIYNGFYKHYGDKFQNIEQLKDENHIAVFHKYLIEFPNLFHLHSCDSSNILIQNSKFTHYYTCKIAIHNSLLKKNKFRKNSHPYGYEDWDLNNRLLAKGIQFKVVDYKLYYRKKLTDSVLKEHTNQKTIVKNSKIYNEGFISSTVTVESKDKYSFFKKVSKFKFLNKLNRKILFREDRNFLRFYGEEYQYREALSHHSHIHLIQELSIQTRYYNTMIDVLLGKEIIYLCSKIRKHISISNKNTIDNIHYLNLGDILDGWNLISEDDQLHIFIKAMINSKVKTVIIGDSELGKKSLQYHHLIYKEYGVEISSIE